MNEGMLGNALMTSREKGDKLIDMRGFAVNVNLVQLECLRPVGIVGLLHERLPGLEREHDGDGRLLVEPSTDLAAADVEVPSF